MSKFVIQAGWKDVGHLTAEAIADMAKAYPPHELEARMNGTPSLGSGAIYPLPESDYVIPDFAVPEHYKRCFGMDVGFSRTACVWLALDCDSDVAYAYSEHYAGEAIPAVHAEASRHARQRCGGRRHGPYHRHQQHIVDVAAAGHQRRRDRAGLHRSGGPRSYASGEPRGQHVDGAALPRGVPVHGALADSAGYGA